MGTSLAPQARGAPRFFIVASLSVTERSFPAQGAHLSGPCSPSPREITAQIPLEPASCLVPRARFGAPNRSNFPALPTRIQRQKMKGDLCSWREKACHLGCPCLTTSQSERRSKSLAPNVGTPNDIGDAKQNLRRGESVKTRRTESGWRNRKPGMRQHPGRPSRLGVDGLLLTAVPV